MMYESNECCGCAVPGYPCWGDACPNRHVLRWACDVCGEDEMCHDDIETIDGTDMCPDCAKKYKEEEEDEGDSD